MILVRSVVFVTLFYLWSLVIGLAMLPLLLAPRRWMIAAMRLWCRVMLALLQLTCNLRVEFRGLEHLPPGPVLVGAKHQCMFDTMAPMTVFTDPCYVMKKELMAIPFYGWFSRKAGMIVVDRDGEAKALRGLLADGKAAIKNRRQVVIFPEGHRMAPGTTGPYQPGVAGLYRTLGAGCVPMATNSGMFWPAHGIVRRPGVIVYEFLEAIPPGLSRPAFMAALEDRIETASRRLLDDRPGL